MACASDTISRYESKYLVSEALAALVRRAIQGVCVPDAHADAQGLYVVNNLYFDTPDLRFYRDTKDKRFTRFKIRVRYYGTEPKGDIWVELKHKVKNVTWKTRRRIDRSDWPDFLLSRPVESAATGRSSLASSFEDAVARFQVRPVVHVQYIREPYVSAIDNYARITLDRQLTFRPAHGLFDLTQAQDMVGYDDSVTSLWGCDDSPVVLEIKTETNIPSWVIALIRRFELSQRGFSKYCYAIDHAVSSAAPSLRVSAFI